MYGGTKRPETKRPETKRPETKHPDVLCGQQEISISGTVRIRKA
jgi:hypothetical protein